MALQRAQIEILRKVARAHRATLARAICFERTAPGFGVGKEASLPCAFLDGAVDVAKADVLAQLHAAIENLKGAARMFASVDIAFM